MLFFDDKRCSLKCLEEQQRDERALFKDIIVIVIIVIIIIGVEFCPSPLSD